MNLKDNYKYAYISTATTTQVVTGSGQLILINVGTTAAGTVTIIDGTAGSTPNIGLLQASILPGTLWFLCEYVNGIRIITGAASALTVIYNPVTP